MVIEWEGLAERTKNAECKTQEAIARSKKFFGREKRVLTGRQSSPAGSC
jgi:hypothetical protein